MDLLKTLVDQLAKYPATHYLVGFSGGRDSQVLLDLLHQLRKRGELLTPLTAIHINHNLNPNADQWAEHCQAICNDYDIPLIVESITDTPSVGESIEAFAREARYQLIAKHLEAGDIFLSAHHQRDQAETFLLQLMRGAGLDGLKAMPVMRDLGAGKYLRPLLGVDFAKIVVYADEKELNYIEDNSNADTRFDRNYLRHEVLPILERRFPKVCKNIAQSAKWLAEVPDVSTRQCLYIADLHNCSDSEKKHQIRAFVKAKTGKSLSQTQTQYLLIHHLTADVDKHPILEIGDIVIRRHEGELLITKPLPPVQKQHLTVKVGMSCSILPLATLAWESGQGLMCDKPLSIKPLRGSERFHPHWRHRTTTVKKSLNEAKIPVWLRPYYVGLYVNNELLAIPGVGVAQKYYQKSANVQMPLWIIEDKFVRM